MIEVTEKDDLKIKCVRCGKNVEVGNVFGFDGEIGYCIDCYIGGGLGSAILDHSYKPVPIFAHLTTEKSNEKEKLLYMGIELETEHRSLNLPKYSFELQKRYPVYVKHDGSLQRGIEIVSHPQTAKYHQKIFKWYELLEELRKGKWTSYDNGRCGIHIHTNKNYFNRKDELLKVVLFHSKCFDKLRQFTKRKETQYCKQWHDSLIKTAESCKGKVAIGSQNDDRHSCINLHNHDTVEFRMYRGTLNYDRFLASILFTDSICSFTRNYSIVFFSNTKRKSNDIWNEYVNYIKNNGRYDFLADYFKKHKLDDAKSIKIDIPPYEDYITKKHFDFTTITGGSLKGMVDGTGIGNFIINEASYEFVKQEYENINFCDIDNYLIYTKGGVPKWIVPKNISRQKLAKREGIASLKMAQIICLYLDIGGYLLKLIQRDGHTYREVTSIQDFFSRAIGRTYNYSSRTSKAEEDIKDFIIENNFKYEIIRSDLINVYNSMQTDG